MVVSLRLQIVLTQVSIDETYYFWHIELDVY